MQSTALTGPRRVCSVAHRLFTTVTTLGKQGLVALVRLGSVALFFFMLCLLLFAEWAALLHLDGYQLLFMHAERLLLVFLTTATGLLVIFLKGFPLVGRIYNRMLLGGTESSDPLESLIASASGEYKAKLIIKRDLRNRLQEHKPNFLKTHAGEWMGISQGNEHVPVFAATKEDLIRRLRSRDGDRAHISVCFVGDAETKDHLIDEVTLWKKMVRHTEQSLPVPQLEFQASINGKPVRFKLDTGATSTCVSWKLFEECDIELEEDQDTEVYLIYGNNERIKSITGIARVTLDAENTVEMTLTTNEKQQRNLFGLDTMLLSRISLFPECEQPLVTMSYNRPKEENGKGVLDAK